MVATITTDDTLRNIRFENNTTEKSSSSKLTSPSPLNETTVMLKADTLKLRKGLSSLLLLAVAATSHAENDDKGKLDIDLSSTLLVMGRNYGEGLSGSSGSASLSVSVKSALSPDLALGLRGVIVENIFEDGKDSAAYWLSNDTSQSLNEAYLNYRANGLGIERAELTVGRVVASSIFFPSYEVRHQAQAMEGVFAKTKVNDRFALDFGHMERFSSWPSRQNGSSSLDTSFKKIGERIGQSAVNSGVQFVASEWNDKGLKLNAYDYYANELYNNAGLRIAYTLPSNDDQGKWTLSAHAIDQRGDSSGALAAHDAESLELNLRYQLRGFSFDTGWTRISRSNALLVPFRTTYVNDATLLWYTNQFEAGTQTYHAKAVYSHKPWTLAAVLVSSSHLDLRNETELDLVAKRKLNEDLSLCIKAGYGKRVFEEVDRRHNSATDLRLFVDYQL